MRTMPVDGTSARDACPKMFKEMLYTPTVSLTKKLEFQWGGQLGQTQVPCAEVRQAL